MDKNPTNVFPNSFPRTELQNCTRGKNSKGASYLFSVSFPPSIRSYTLLPPPSLPRILASSSLSLFMIHPEQSKKREQGGFRTTIPSFQIFAFNYFLSIFAALFPSSVRVPEKQSHSVFLPSPNSTFLQYSMRIATPLIFVP